MPVIPTHQIAPGQYDDHTTQQIYNGLDCCITLEVNDRLDEIMQADRRQSNLPACDVAYGFERALQAPCMEMMLRGFRVDEFERRANIDYCTDMIKQYETILNEFAVAVWDKPLNPRSTDQLKEFFYKHMRIEPIVTSKKGERKESMDRDTLEKLQVYFHAQPIISCILGARDFKKQKEILETEVDSDGRMRTSYNIAGTETWRFSSSANAYGTGGNLQNIKIDPADPEVSKSKSIRKMFIADPGWKICGIDLEQAESREVGWLLWVLFGDARYLDACEGGDLHTSTSKLIWPGLGWTGDPVKDRKIADQMFYREFSYRDMSKRGGHGTTYYGTPPTMARHLKVTVKLMQDFQQSFFGAYPGIPKWHQWVAEQIQTKPHSITTPFGVTRNFFGRPGDDTTLREAIAFSPQSSTAVRLNLALWRIWYYMKDRIQLLAQVHDALYFQYRETDNEAEVVKIALELVRVLLQHNGRNFIIPGEAKVGWNWGNYHKKMNPDGLMKFKPSIPDLRIRQTGLNRVM